MFARHQCSASCKRCGRCDLLANVCTRRDQSHGGSKTHWTLNALRVQQLVMITLSCTCAVWCGTDVDAMANTLAGQEHPQRARPVPERPDDRVGGGVLAGNSRAQVCVQVSQHNFAILLSPMCICRRSVAKQWTQCHSIFKPSRGCGRVLGSRMDDAGTAR